MPNLIALSTLFTLALSLPTPTTAHQLPTVHLQTFGPSTSSFSPSLQKSTLSNGGQIISIPLGASLSSLADKPLELQGIELVGVEGAALDDVECRAQISWSSRSVKVGVKDGVVMLHDEGGVVSVTGLVCVVGRGRESAR